MPLLRSLKPGTGSGLIDSHNTPWSARNGMNASRAGFAREGAASVLDQSEVLKRERNSTMLNATTGFIPVVNGKQVGGNSFINHQGKVRLTDNTGAIHIIPDEYVNEAQIARNEMEQELSEAVRIFLISPLIAAQMLRVSLTQLDEYLGPKGTSTKNLPDLKSTIFQTQDARHETMRFCIKKDLPQKIMKIRYILAHTSYSIVGDGGLSAKAAGRRSALEVGNNFVLGELGPADVAEVRKEYGNDAPA